MITKKLYLVPVLRGAESLDDSLRSIAVKEEKDRVYTYLRDAMYWQNKAYNQLLSAVYAESIRGNYDNAKELLKLGSRNPGTNKAGGSFWSDEYDFKKMLSTPSTISYMVKNYMSSTEGREVLKGNVTLRNMKRDAPLQLIKKAFEFYYDSGFDIYQEDACLYIRIGSKRDDGCHFRVNFGPLYKSMELRSTMDNVLNGLYSVGDSKVMIDSKGRIVFLLSVDIPVKEIELDSDTVVGVDLGVSVPAVCALNNSPKRKYVGNGEDFCKMRDRMDKERETLQQGLVFSHGGHGREKKLARLNKVKHRQKEWGKSVDHKISNEIVQFAIRNRAATIQMEDLHGIRESEKVFRNWSYYRIQEYTKYKAEKYGITVVFVNPCYTTQVCSECGAWEESRYTSQSSFQCPNPKCPSKKYAKRVNPDFNAARNIAKSTLYTTGKESRKKLLEDAKKYYSIPEQKEND